MPNKMSQLKTAKNYYYNKCMTKKITKSVAKEYQSRENTGQRI